MSQSPMPKRNCYCRSERRKNGQRENGNNGGGRSGKLNGNFLGPTGLTGCSEGPTINCNGFECVLLPFTCLVSVVGSGIRASRASGCFISAQTQQNKRPPASYLVVVDPLLPFFERFNSIAFDSKGFGFRFLEGETENPVILDGKGKA